MRNVRILLANRLQKVFKFQSLIVKSANIKENNNSSKVVAVRC